MLSEPVPASRSKLLEGASSKVPLTRLDPLIVAFEKTAVVPVFVPVRVNLPSSLPSIVWQFLASNMMESPLSNELKGGLSTVVCAPDPEPVQSIGHVGKKPIRSVMLVIVSTYSIGLETRTTCFAMACFWSVVNTASMMRSVMLLPQLTRDALMTASVRGRYRVDNRVGN